MGVGEPSSILPEPRQRERLGAKEGDIQDRRDHSSFKMDPEPFFLEIEAMIDSLVVFRTLDEVVLCEMTHQLI